MKKVFQIGALSAGVLAMSSCGERVSLWQDESKVNVVATTTMITDLVKVIGGDKVEVMGMMQPGIDPHGYEQTASDVAVMNSADVIFYNGLHLEIHMQDGLEKRSAKGDSVYAVTKTISSESLIQPQDDSEGYADPHVWGDPSLWAKTIDVVVEGLSKEAPEFKAEFQENGEAYRAELVKLKAWGQARVAEIPETERVLVTSHDAFSYSAQAYGFEVKGLQGVSTQNVSSVKDVEELVGFIKARQLKTIFPESSVNKKGIETVAEQAGVHLNQVSLFADALGEPGDVTEVNGESYDRGTYIGMQKHNINVLVEGLKGKR